MTTRVYVPSTIGRLRQVVTADGVGPAPFHAHAVTEAVRAQLPEGDTEEWEHAAASAAAQSSVGLLHDDDPARRVVLAVDVGNVRDAGLDDRTLVEVDEVVPLRRLAAVLADGPEAEADVAAARDALAEGKDAEALLARCLDHELAWWATQEIGDLLGQ